MKNLVKLTLIHQALHNFWWLTDGYTKFAVTEYDNTNDQTVQSCAGTNEAHGFIVIC